MAESTEKGLEALLTVDDGPSAATGAIVRHLSARGIPAVFFFRGDAMAAHPRAVVEAIEAGFLIGNHLYGHRRASQVPVAETIVDIGRTQSLIDAAYAQAGRVQPVRLLRFPHMDCGLGGWIVDYETIKEAGDRKALESLFGEGLNVAPAPPTAAMRQTRAALTDHLERAGFAPLPCPAVPPRWFRHLADERNAPFTFSTADWKLTVRHRGRHADIQTVEDAVRKIDTDLELNRPGAGAILLMHDQEDLLPVFCRLTDHFLEKKTRFVNLV